MTTARSGSTKSRKPAHQNSFAFQHNKGSKKTLAIRAIPVHGVCGRCREKIEWRKKFRKYKPLTTPRKCQLCEQKTVKAAYHVICDVCSMKVSECTMCRTKDFNPKAEAQEKLDSELLETAQRTLRERERRSLVRILEEKGESEAIAFLRMRMGMTADEDGEDDEDDLSEEGPGGADSDEEDDEEGDDEEIDSDEA